jgi:hypothetical protein
MDREVVPTWSRVVGGLRGSPAGRWAETTSKLLSATETAMPMTAERNIGSLRELPTASRGHLELQLGLDGCFSSERVELRLMWTEYSGEVELRPTHGPVKSLKTSDDEARSYVAKIADALLCAEVLVGGRSTTRYFGTARWEAISDHACETGEAEWETNDLAPEVLAEVLAARPELSSRIPAATYTIAFGVRAIVDQIQQILRSRLPIEHRDGD